MRTYERNEVVVDQCSGCGGLFLELGELERLVTAESAYYGASAGQAPQSAPPAHQPPPRHDDRGHDNRHGKSRKSKKRSFLEELFE